MHSSKLNINAYKLFVFDFDGVIIDSVSQKKKNFLKIFIKYSLTDQAMIKNYDDENSSITRFEKINYIYKNILNKKLDTKEMKRLNRFLYEANLANIKKCKKIKGIRKFMNRLKKENKILIINSATPTGELKKIIHNISYTNYFSDIYGSPKIKEDNFNLIFKKYNIKKKEIVFFGDSLSDFTTSKKFNIDFIGVGKNIMQYLNENENFHIKDFSWI